MLSGFLITGILLDNKDRPHYFRNFYLRRFFRIIPLYFATIVVFWCAYGHSSYFLFSVVFLANMAGILGIDVPHGPGVYWSLAIEEQFYLLWPTVVRNFTKRLLVIICAALCLVEPVGRYYAVLHRMDYYSYTWFRLDGLATGALLALWFVRASRPMRVADGSLEERCCWLRQLRSQVCHSEYWRRGPRWLRHCAARRVT